MADCAECVALQRQYDLLANDRDGYVQLLTNENNKLRAENEKLRAALEDIAYPNPLHNEDDLMRIARAAREEKQ